MNVILKPTASLPKRHSEGAAGYDLCAYTDGTIPANGMLRVDTGVSIKCPKGIACILMSRSGLAVKHKLDVVRNIVKEGDIVLYMVNHGDEDFSFKKGERIAQMVFAEIDEE